tara:strand:- start:31246 stop:32733 length:1488 start_codon:yes stop_codon:yes gene_type:complete
VKKLIIILSTLIVFQCGKTNIVKLPITTKSEKALSFYNKAILEWEAGGDIEKRAFLDSAILYDKKFALAYELNDISDPIKRKEYIEKAKSLISGLTNSEKYILHIRNSFRENNLDAALKYANKLVDEFPDYYESYNWLGIVHSNRNELKEAEKNFMKGISINNNNFIAYNFLAGQHIPSGGFTMLPIEKRDIEKGLSYIDKMIKIRPNSGYPYHIKANVYRSQSQFDKANPLYEKSIEKRKGTSSLGTAYIVSGHNYMFNGDYNAARNRYKLAIKESKSADGWFGLNYYLTISFLFDNDFPGALNNIEKVEESLVNKGFSDVALLEKTSTINFHKLICYAHSQRKEKSYNTLEKIIELNKSRAEKLNDENIYSQIDAREKYLKAWVDILFGNYEDAKKSLRDLKQTQSEKKDPTALYGYNGLMGMTKLMEGSAKEAVSFFNKGDKNNTYYNYFKGLALKAAGEKELANKEFNNIINDNFSYWELAIVKKLAKEQI